MEGKMGKFNNLFSSILVIVLPLALILISSNITLRLSDAYVYHFNDSEALDEIPYEISKTEMAEGITDYLNSFSKNRFQIYEDNGIYQDPIFDYQDRNVMEKTKKLIVYGLALGLLCLAATIYIYIWCLKKGIKKLLKSRFSLAITFSIILFIANAILVSNQNFRSWLNLKFIGIVLDENSILNFILGGNYFSTYILFTSVIGIILICAISYITYILTKPSRIFY